MAKKTPTRTFTIPTEDSQRISEIQSLCRKHDLSLNDSEVVRAGLAALLSLPDKKFIQTVKSVLRLRRGKPPQQD